MLVQLSGVPGSGKSTLARRLAAGGPFVVVDSDVLKSALLTAGAPVHEAGRLGYAAALALARDLLRQGREVIIDSPCRYPELLAAGQEAAGDAGVAYAFVELLATDPAFLLPRLDQRAPLPSQVASSGEPAAGTVWEAGTAEETMRAWQRQLVRPDQFLRLDAAADPDDNAHRAMTYLDSRR